MHLSIITPQEKIFEGEITSLSVQTPQGEITILPHHINIVTEVTPGELVIKKHNKTDYIGVAGGFLEMANNTITILADYAVASEKIAASKAIEAQKRADELKKRAEEQLSQKDLAIIQSDLRKSLMELQVATRRRHRERTI